MATAYIIQPSNSVFDGTSSYITYGNSTDFNTTAFTVELMYTPLTLLGVIFGKWATNADFFLTYNGTKLLWKLNAWQLDNVESTTNLVVGTTYHVVIASNGTNEYLYVNGVREGTEGLNTARSTNSEPLELGRSNFSQDKYSNMSVTCFAYYQETWDDAKVADRYANFSKTTIPSENCVLFVNNNNLTQDLSGAGHHGTAFNMGVVSNKLRIR